MLVYDYIDGTQFDNYTFFSIYVVFENIPYTSVQ